MNGFGNVQVGSPGFGIGGTGASAGYLTNVNVNGSTANITIGGNQLFGVQESYESNLWGPKRNLDYWTARSMGLVPEPERRAMKLLASECDEERFSLYCRIGLIAALGNVTKHLYLVRRYCTVREIEDGRYIQDWCVMTRDRDLIPETDHVLALKSLVEGEELFFRETGNRTTWGTEGKHTDPYRMSFLEPNERIVANESIADFESLPRTMQSMRFQMWFRYRALIEQAKFKLPMARYEEGSKPLELPSGLDQMIREEVRARLQGVGQAGVPNQQIAYAY